MNKKVNYKKKIQKRRHRKMRRRRVLFFILVGLIIASIGYTFYHRLVVSPKKTTPSHVEYRDVVKGEGYLILEENLVFTKANGIAIYNAREGKKVPKDFVVADINVMNDNSKVKDQLIRIQAAIDFKNDNISEEKRDDHKKEDETVIRNIQRFLRDEDYDKLISSINTLDLSTKHTVNVSELNELLKLSVPVLEEQKEILTERIASSSSDYKAPLSGIISYTFDDIRKDLSLEHDDEIFTRDYLKNVNVGTVQRGKSRVKEGKAFFRSIGDTYYKIALPIEDARLLNKDIGKTLSIRIGKVMTKAKILSINTDESGSVAILELRDKLHQVYLPRKQKVTLVKDTLYALKIPQSAIVKDSKGNIGVYVNAVRGFVKFVPIDLLTTRGKDAFCHMGNEKHEIKKKNGDMSKTIALDDVIILEPKKVKKEKVVY